MVTNEEQLEKTLTDEIVEFSEALAGTLPTVGSLAQYIVRKLHRGQYDRAVRAVVSLRERVNALEDKASKVLTYDDLEFMLERYLEQLAKPNTEERKTAFQDAFVGSLMDGNIDYDEQKEFIRLIDQIPEMAISALITICVISEDAEWQSREVESRSFGSSIHTFLEDFLKPSNSNVDEVFSDEVLHFLEREFLVKDFQRTLKTLGTARGMMNVLCNHTLTEKGFRIARILKAGRNQRALQN